MLTNLRIFAMSHQIIPSVHINNLCCYKIRASLKRLKPYVLLGRNYSSLPGLIGNDIKSLHSVISPPIAKIRNIGIMAHIDAGKTTTTERILYYSGYTRSLGDVDDGDTVTDFMAQERERGITIQSAAVTFDWKGYRVNLIDTPGHVDFTLEVERCLRVLDGAVAVFDASAGVEAQTLTVWRQADKHKIPRICFLNKMDKTGASFKYAVESIREKLKAKPLLLQLPIGEAKTFKGLVDVVTKEKLLWNSNSNDGKDFERKPLLEVSDPELLKETTEARNALIEQVADLDDEFADLVLGEFSENFDLLPAEKLQNAIHRVTLAQTAVPVLCGSALKNKGVQPLLDAVTRYLPSPEERNYEFLERVSRLLLPFADQHIEISSLTAGNIALTVGLKHTATGDTLVSSKSSALAAARRAEREGEKKHRQNSEAERLLLAGVEIPEPVFFCTIEPPSVAKQPGMNGLEFFSGFSLLLAHTQTLKCGIIISEVPNIQFVYRHLDKPLGDLTANLVTVESGEARPIETSSLSESINEDAFEGLPRGIENGIHSAFILVPSTNYEISACVSRCVQKAMKKADKQVLEPLMNLEVTVARDYLSPVLGDLAQRRGNIQEIQTRQDNKVIIGFVPLAEIMGYSTALRTLTSGSATFALELSTYQAMNPQDQNTLLNRRSGLT
uniref:GTP dependent ribosome recycling factor mitochondrial 2 n=1 Tax=Aotus nancymaae TaxID=37293 RepID=A0A2K5DG74_AOTNA